MFSSPSQLSDDNDASKEDLFSYVARFLTYTFCDKKKILNVKICSRWMYILSCPHFISQFQISKLG